MHETERKGYVWWLLDPIVQNLSIFVDCCDMVLLVLLVILCLSSLLQYECVSATKKSFKEGLNSIPVHQSLKLATTEGRNKNIILADSEPTEEPTQIPTLLSTLAPSEEPTTAPTEPPTGDPTESPTADPTAHPTSPTAEPSLAPTLDPSTHPTVSPTGPSYAPSASPSSPPTIVPTLRPTRNPTLRPTRLPSADPTFSPTFRPTGAPSNPTARPSTASPTLDIVAIQFTSDLTFINMNNETLSESDADTVRIAAALSMSVNSQNVTFLTQSSAVQVRRPAYWSAKYWSRSSRRLLNQYTIVVTVSTLVNLPRVTTPNAFYTLLTTRLNTAVSTATFLNYLRLFEQELTFDGITISDISVVNNALVLAGAPTFAPTRGPTYNLPRRMENAPLIGTVLGAFFGSMLLAFLLYRVILHMREKREDQEYKYMNANKLLNLVEKEVFLPREIEDGVPLPLEPVRKQTLKKEIASLVSESSKTGVVQIVFESDRV